ncbi:MAG TPA: hypothetical protein VER11_32820 [Polyangiaceae bacterium]|nr:hypothetical protein [Polyangiaceae bacterium]
MRELLRHWMPQRLVGFLCAFLCVFAGLALAHGPGPVFSKAHAALGNVLVGRNALASGVKLHFEASDAELEAHPWRVTLHIQPAGRVPAVLVPIDVRSLLYLPMAAFVALAIAVRLRSLREHVKLLAVGLAILEPLLLLLVALPLLSFLGGTGPIRAFSLSRPTHVLLQISYRALVVPPGMAYALPLFLWWSLLMTINRNGTQNSPSRNTNLLDGSA